MGIPLATCVFACVCVWSRAVTADAFAAVPLRPVRVLHVLSAAPPQPPQSSQTLVQPSHQGRHVSPSTPTPSIFYYFERPIAPRHTVPTYDDTYDDPVPTKETKLSPMTVPRYRYRYPDEVYEVPARAPRPAVFRYPSDSAEPEFSEELEEEPQQMVGRPALRPRRPPVSAAVHAAPLAHAALYPALHGHSARPARHVSVTTESPVIIRIHKYRIVKTNQ